MEVIASVTDRYGTYTASSEGIRASCTAGAQQAVERLASKVFGPLQRTSLAEIAPRDAAGVSYWRITTDPDQACRNCGCTWVGGCYWAEPDLCSSCQTKEVA